jgi:hypothetical protein
MMPKIVYSPEIVNKIIQSLSAGVPKKFACQSNGISADALNDWENGRGAIPPEDVDHLNQRIMEAEASAVAVRIGRIALAAQKGEWKADTWYLEHVHHDVFSPRTQNDTRVSDADGNPLRIVIERITPDAKPEPSE